MPVRPKLLIGLLLGAGVVLAGGLLSVWTAQRALRRVAPWMGPSPTLSLGAGGGYVTTGQPPQDLVPAEDLSPEERRRNFEALATGIADTYAMFRIKSIDWPQVVARYRLRVARAASTEEYYQLLWLLVNELHDTHSWVQGSQEPQPRFRPRLALDQFGSRDYVVLVPPGSPPAEAGVRVGWEVVEVDGVPLAERVRQTMPRLKALSSERATQRQAYRSVLAGGRGTMCKITFRLPSGERRRVSLKRVFPGRVRPQGRYPAQVAFQHFAAGAVLPSGLGYIRIASFEGRGEIATEFAAALEPLRDTPGLVLDVRGNEGGFGNAQPEIVGRFLTKRTLVAISYSKQPGPGTALTRHEQTFRPTGSWRYTKPVALLTDADTGSAADLFVCYMRAAPHVTTVGSPTHGNLSGVGAYIVLPCNLVVRVSNGYVCDAKGTPIEGRGNVPDVLVEPTIEDVAAGRDPALERAVVVLRSDRHVGL